MMERNRHYPVAWRRRGSLVTGNAAERLTALKQQPGKDIGTVGSATLVGSPLREGVLDELRLLVHPIVAGRGRRLFPDGVAQTPLELVDARTFSTGVVQLTYRPWAEDRGGQ